MATQSKENQKKQEKLFIGIALGNKMTHIYCEQKVYSLVSEITINQSQKNSIQIGRAKKLLEQKLTVKKPSQTVLIKDFIDLFVHQLKSEAQFNKKHDYYQKKINQQFSYYRHNFRLNEEKGIDILLDKQFSIIQRQNKFEQYNYLVDKKQQPIIKLDQCVLLFLKGVLDNILLIYNKNKNTSKQLAVQVIINFNQTEGNACLTSIKNIGHFVGQSHQFIKSVQTLFRPSTTSLCVYYYFMKCINLKKSQTIGVLDFGDRNLSFSIIKMYSHRQNIVEVLETFSYQFGGIDITRCIMDLIIQHVKLHKSVNLKTTPQMLQQLYNLSQQAKHSLSQMDEVYVRISGYPLQQPYGFYLSRARIQKVLLPKITSIINQIQNIIIKFDKQIKKIIVSGKSLGLPCFSQLFYKIIVKDKQIVKVQQQNIAIGNSLSRSKNIIILQKSSFSLNIKSDDDYSQMIILKNQDLPLRFYKELQFPRGQLTYRLNLYQNQLQVIQYTIESKYLNWQQKIHLIVQNQEHRTLSVYSPKYLGQCVIKGQTFCKSLKLKNNVQILLFFQSTYKQK